MSRPREAAERPRRVRTARVYRSDGADRATPEIGLVCDAGSRGGDRRWGGVSGVVTQACMGGELRRDTAAGIVNA